MSKDELDIPGNEDDLYLARGEEVSPARPLLLGDVLIDIALPGLDDEPGPVMILAHPCTMRRGTELRERIVVSRVSARQSFPFQKWASGWFDLMPLPGLPLDIPVKGQQYAADFTELSTVSSAELLRAKRIACLSETGITLLLQRHTHHLSRAVIDLPTFYQSISGVLTEAELEQDWVEGLVPGIWDNPDPDQLANASKAFHEFLGPPGSDLREKLKQVRTQAEVRRTVREEIRARRQQA